MLNDFIKGISAYTTAFRLISQLRLWFFALIPSMLSLLLAGIIGVTIWGFADDIGNFLISFYPWDWGKEIITNIATAFGGLILASSGLIIYKHLILILSAPFMSELSQKVEAHLTGRPYAIRFAPIQMLKDAFRGLRLALRNILRELFYTFLLLLLGLIPIFSPFTAFLIFAIQAFYAGFGNIDYTLERHYTLRQSIQFIKQNKGLALGNGSVFIGLLAFGIGFILAPPLATVAATIETVKRI